MSEIITAYHLNRPWDPFPMKRDEFYDEQIDLAKGGRKANKGVGVFATLLFTERKEIILQKRSHTKRHNANLIDKTVGGHIQYGDSLYYTVMVECVQELQVPAVVLRQDEHFARTYESLSASLESVAIMKMIDSGLIPTKRVFQDDSTVEIVNYTNLFFGIYSGAAKPVDREASGILYYELDVLEKEMEKVPQIFTPDLHYYISTYRTQIDNFLSVLDEVK